MRQGDGGVYVNFLGDEGEARIREAYPGATFERLAEIKGRYDSTNLFRLNQNIPPATGVEPDAMLHRERAKQRAYPHPKSTANDSVTSRNEGV